MSPKDFLLTVIRPTLAEMVKASPEAELQLLVTPLQESGLTALQQEEGPAVSYFQIEPNGIRAVMANPSVSGLLHAYCERHGYPFDEGHIYLSIAEESAQGLACCVARCILLADANQLPAVGDLEGAWSCYLRNWRPGKPSKIRWDIVYPTALAVIQECV